MTASEKGGVNPIELQQEQAPVQQQDVPPSESSQMNIDVEHPPGATESLAGFAILPEQLPLYRPKDGAEDEEQALAADIEVADDMQAFKDSEDDDHSPGDFYRDDSSSEVDLQHERNSGTWVSPPGNTSDLVGQSSDEYEDGVGDEEDEVDDDEEFSDDTGDMEEMQEIPGKSDFVYSRVAHRGPYLKSRLQTEQLRKHQSRSGALRKRPLRLRTISGSGPRFDIGVGASVASESGQGDEPESPSPESLFTQTCEEVTLKLHQGLTQHGVDTVKGLIKYALEWRNNGAVPQGCPYSVEQLHVLENTFFAVWAKLLIERRPSPLNTAIVLYLQDFVRLGCALVQKENSIPDPYAEVLTAMFEKGDLEIYRRNPKRPSRLAHMTRFQEYASEYSTEEDEVPQLQQDLQRLFSNLGGLEGCMKAIEAHIQSTESTEIKLRNLNQLLGLMSRIQVATDLDHVHTVSVSELSKRLIAAVLGYFPDNGDGFRSASKATVLEIISHVGVFLVENYRLQTSYSTVIQEPDTDYEEFDLHDPISRSNLGEAKFADFRLEMAVRLMKTSRLDLRLAGLVELKEVLVRVQRLQQGRSRLRRRSETDMEVQMEQDRVPIEHLCSKLQSLQIVGFIFGPNIHLEIVQRSTDVLAFMAQAKVLTMADIGFIWAAVGGSQHRSIVYGVYQVLSELCSKLPQAFLRDLFNKLQAVPLENWDLQLVELARSLFHAMVQREEGSISLIPYETLLHVLRNSTKKLNARDDHSFGTAQPLGRDVIGGIAQLVSDGLAVGPTQSDRRALVEYCLKDVKSNHPGAIWSLQVIQKIFELHFLNDEKGRLQFYKQSCSSLPELYISNLKEFASTAKAIPPTPSPTVTSFGSLSTLYQAQEYWRSLQLTIRLDFLKVMAKVFAAAWNSPELADTVWYSLIADPIGNQEQDATFSCLESMAEPRFVEHRMDPTVEGSQIIVVLGPLYGMDLAWQIALHARLSIVGAHAIELLSSLIKLQSGQEESLAPTARDAVYKFREGLVETCIGYLVESSGALSKDGDKATSDVSLVFERCIGILKAFLAACTSEVCSKATRCEIHGALDEDAMLTLKVNSTIVPNFQVIAHPSSTLASLRRMIAVKLGCVEPEEVRLFLFGKDIVPSLDNKTLEELDIEHGQTLLASKRPLSAMPVQRSEDMKRIPTDLLLKPDFFERVQRIFLLDEKYASQAWEIVTRLPTSPVLLSAFEELQEHVDWTALMDARSPFLLLYSLQILDSLIRRDQNIEDLSKQIWIKRFLALGGQQRLIALLMSESGLGAENSSPTARKALGLMLKVLVRLTGSADTESIMATASSGLTVPVLLNRLVSEILTSAARGSEHNTNDQAIVLNATSLISHLCAGPQGWNYLHAGPDIRSLLFVSMVQSDSMQIRQTVLEMGTKFCLQTDMQSSDTSPVLFFLDILQSFLPISKEYEANCSELFEFFEIVSREATNQCSEDYYRALYARLMETIISHPSTEDVSSPREDTVLIGMLKVATAMISVNTGLKQLDMEYRVVSFIFDECLFPKAPVDSPFAPVPKAAKCVSEGSRSAAFNYLEEAVKGTPDALRLVMMKTREHFDRDSATEGQWGYDPQTIKKARCGFVGLQNLGATCYVNSIIQQFYMNEAFRHGILNTPSGDDDDKKHDTLLYQLQVLFGNLQESKRRSYNAHGFCYAYKDWDGNPMNVAVQMDVDEFFNILFDRLESSVKSTPQEDLFKQQYGGKLVQQIKSKDCEHISEREDSFFSIQCEVKNKKTLEESLQLYVQGEILDGDNKYKCSSCDKHVDAIKRVCIKELPRNLILHLKRFDYDMDTMRRIKINDRFEFPTRLDMEPYTLDYLTRKEQAQEGANSSPLPFPLGLDHNAASQYNLVGVLVHTGTADSGHYYSYIKDRGLDTSSALSSGSITGSIHDGSRWYHFNDSKVEEFDASEIPAKAFGGQEFVPQELSPYMKSPPRSTTKPYSAYMLFYERADTAAHRQQIPPAEVPGDIKDVVVKENAMLLKDLSVFDRLYYQFVWDLFNMYQTIPAMDQGDGPTSADPLDYVSMQYGLDFFFSVLIHARDVDQELQQWVRYLSSLLAAYPTGCAKFLRSLALNQQLLSSVLLLCPITQVREAVIDLIFEALHSLREQDKIEYGQLANTMVMESFARSEDGRADDDWIWTQGSVIHSFIRTLLDLLPEARANWRNFDEYFKLMYNVTQLGRAERVLMVREGYLSELVEFYVGDERNDSKKKKMGDKFTKPNFRYLLLTIQENLVACDITHSYEALQKRNSGHSMSSSAVRRASSADSSSSTSSVSSTNSDEVVMENDIHLASASPELEQPLILSQSDLNALFACHGPPGSGAEKSLLFITKMLQDRTESTIISRIVTHLSSHGAIGDPLLESLFACLAYANEDQFTTIMQVFKDLVLLEDGRMEKRVKSILTQLVTILEHSPQPSMAYDCLDFFRSISDFGQCGRFAQAWLLQNSHAWLHELLLMQSDSDTRMRARLFFMELLSSERAFNGWSDDQAAIASAQHFSRLLELMKVIPELLAFYPAHSRRDDDDAGWRFVEYFKALAELVRSDSERELFFRCWSTFIDILTKIDSQQLNLDYDKKEMMVFWGRIMDDDTERNMQLANFPPVGHVLRRFYVCLQNNPMNVQFHRDVLPIYFGLVLRFCRLSQAFHAEWMRCTNYTWAIQTMIWGAFIQHCPSELRQLLQYTLTEHPLYRQECWRLLQSVDPTRFLASFTLLSRATFAAENQLAGALFYQFRGLIHLTDVMKQAEQSGTVTKDHEFFAVDALTLLSDYLCKMTICRNTAAFAEAIDHWSNIEDAIKLLSGNLMWSAPPRVYAESIKILTVIAQEATYTQASPILAILNSAHCEWRDSFDAGGVLAAQLPGMFGGTHSPYCQYGIVEAPQTLASVGSPPMRIGPLIFMHPELFERLDANASQNVLDQWFVPYWSLVQQTCKMDGGKEHYRKAIELAALLAIEQLPAGSLMHLETLGEILELAADDDEDMRRLFENAYVVMFLERFLNRDRCLEALEVRHLETCSALLKRVSTAMEDSELFFATIAEESFARAEEILERRGESLPMPLNYSQLDEASDETLSAESDARGLITSLQNLRILDFDADAPESTRLRHVQDRIYPVLVQFPERYTKALSILCPATTPERVATVSTNEATAAADDTSSDEAMTAGAGSDVLVTVVIEEDTVMMTGVVQGASENENENGENVAMPADKTGSEDR
ncbi:hypothetical protein BGX28_004397 [Mortierella sp. GBA30]|nr:hypothetical protein BGX28_004397 [Mortierella sp. GBA30]